MNEQECGYSQAGLGRAWDGDRPRAAIRTVPEDFQVDEELGFEPDGAGEHVWLQIRKSGLNTQDVNGRIARLCSVREHDVGFSGLKDRHALTSQWFSVALPPAREPDWTALEVPDSLWVLRSVRHGRKLRRGTHRRNRFSLRARALEGDRQLLAERLAGLGTGVPNYFGEQRFGAGEANLHRAWQMFQGGPGRTPRHRRGLYLSAARAMLFNLLLSERVADGSWDRPLAGDVMMLEGSHSVFATEQADATLVSRCRTGDIHPTGPLWGRGELTSRHAAHALETALAVRCATWCRGLEQAGLQQERRALRLLPRDIAWSVETDELALRFSLPSGAFATSVLRECLDYA